MSTGISHAKANKPHPVLVEWEDSGQALPAWQWLDDMAGPSVVICKSVGSLVLKNEEAELRLAVSLGGDDDECQVSGIIAIPARSVLKVVPLINPSPSLHPDPSACQAAE